MTPLIIFPIALALVFLYNWAERRAEHRTGRMERKEAERRLSEIARAGRVLSALRSAYSSLQRQRAAGYGPWLSCCLERVAAGENVTPEVAITALTFTRRDLLWGRFNLDALDAAIAKLEEETGEGE